MKRNPFLTILIIFLTSTIFNTKIHAQTNFTGRIVYTVEMMDTTLQELIDNREMTIYTNDTLSRVEVQNDALGNQITIKHLALKKSYLLMNLMGNKLAIQTDYSSDTTKVEPYSFKYHFFGKKKVNGQIMKKVTVYREDLKENRVCWYFKNIRPDLMDIYPGIKGLPAEFYMGTVDGIVKYTLQSVENKPIDKDLFGIPSDYKKITLQEFMQYVRGGEN
jgi:hypothetical protein